MAVSQVTVEIATQSQQQPSWQNQGKPPKIVMNGKPFPQPAGPNFSSGIQVAVLDPTMDITNPASIRSNSYHWLPDVDGSWMSYYQDMWDKAASQIYTSGNTDQQIVFLATFGMDINAAPTSAALELLIELGAGPQLQRWWTSVDVGSQGGGWISRPGNYILVGQPALGFGEGAEIYESGGNPVTTSISTTLTNFGAQG